MKVEYRGLYVYLGWNGVIVALDFDFRRKAYSTEFCLFWCRFDLEVFE